MSVDLTSYLASQTPATTTVASSNGADALASGQSNLDTSYQTFLTLLTSQLQHQDPTAPMDPNSFTQQLVQMTGVQQQLLSNQLLQQLVTQSGASVTGAVGLIGKTVTAASDTASLSGGKADWSYTLPQAASQATMTITDSSGRVMWSGTAPDLSSGTHAFEWNGASASGQASPDGSYKLSINAVDANGAAITATSSISGVVNSVSQVNGATVINIGNVQTPLTAVSAVTAT